MTVTLAPMIDDWNHEVSFIVFFLRIRKAFQMKEVSFCKLLRSLLVPSCVAVVIGCIASCIY